MTKEEMAKAYADGFEDKHYREIAYDAFICGYGAKCDTEHRKDLLKLYLTADDIRQITKINYEIIFKDTSGIKCKNVAEETLRRFLEHMENEK